MRKIVLLLLLFPSILFARSSESGLGFFSNVNYSPFGLFYMKNPTADKNGFLLTLKISEGAFLRNTDYKYGSSKSGIFDVDFINATACVSFLVMDNLHFNAGGGLALGVPTDMASSSDPEPVWTSSTREVSIAPVIAAYFSFYIKKVKVIVGHETAFATYKRYPVQQLNTKSAARLPSFVFGVGF